MPRHAAVRVDTEAVAHNVRALLALADGAELCAVVKADGYGHGAVAVARAALDAGATRLAVALVEEGAVLRDAGIEAPVLLLSEPPLDSLRDAWDLALTPTLYHLDAVKRAAEVVPRAGRWGVHLKVDTGMHRVGVLPAQALEVARSVGASSELLLEGVFTHLAVADEPERPETAEQLARFDAVIDELVSRGIEPGLTHAANSAGCISHPASRRHMVRCGIAVYGLAPSPAMGDLVDLHPAMEVVTEVTHVAVIGAGDGVSYGLRHRFEQDTEVAVVPLGYADGVDRRLGCCGGEVLIGGVRRPIRGTVTMDQLVVELGPAGSPGRRVGIGDEVVLIGAQDADDGSDRIGVQDWAAMLGTISYEVVCRFGQRIPRVYT